MSKKQNMETVATAVVRAAREPDRSDEGVLFDPTNLSAAIKTVLRSVFTENGQASQPGDAFTEREKFGQFLTELAKFADESAPDGFSECSSAVGSMKSPRGPPTPKDVADKGPAESLRTFPGYTDLAGRFNLAKAPHTEAAPPPAILRRRQVEQRTGLCRSAIYAGMSAQTFPSAVRLGSGRSVGWVDSEIQNWIDAQISASRGIAS